MGKVLDRGTYTSVTEMSLLPVPRIPMASNVTGTWILENCHQAWRERGVDLAAIAREVIDQLDLASIATDVIDTGDTRTVVRQAPIDAPARRSGAFRQQPLRDGL